MRTDLRHAATWLSITGAVLTGCTSHQKTDGNTCDDSKITSTDVLFSLQQARKNYVTEGSNALFNDSVHIYSTISIEIQWPVKIGNHDISELQDSLQTLALGTTKGPIKQAIQSMLSNPVGHGLYTLSPVDSIDNKAMVLYQQIQANTITFNERYIVYGVTRSAYEGGAHDMTATSYLTWLLEPGETMSLANAFKPGYEDPLLEIIKKRLMEMEGVNDANGLSDKGFFPESIYISPNFYISGYEFIFHYNPYDIASYATGSIDVRIPYHTIVNLISPRLLQIFESESC